MKTFLHKIIYFIPIQLIVLFVWCGFLTFSPYVFYVSEGFTPEYKVVYFIRMFGVASMMFASIGFLFAQKWDETMERSSALIRENVLAELQFLRSQTNPHFLLNTMNSIYALSLKQSPDTYLVISELKNIFSYLQDNEEKGSIENELNYLKNFIRIQKRRIGNHLELNVDMHTDNDYQIEPMLLSIFIENAFKHGISMRDRSYINVYLHVENNHLEYNVVNSNHAQLSKDSTLGIGQINLKRRLELLYPNRYTLICNNEGKEYCSTLLLSLE